MQTLAPRQQQALTLKARGFSHAEAAHAMHCSVANVNNLLRECFYKLHARGTPDAIAKAMKHSLIHLCLVLTVSAHLNDLNDDQMRNPIRGQLRLVKVARRKGRED